MKKIYYAMIIGVMLLTSCTSSLTRGTQYPKMYEEKPVSILIMPPINRTNSVEAKEYFYTSLAYPLCEKGYYVVSPFLAMDIMQQESAYDSEMFIEGKLDPFRNVFGVDAALFTIINDWSKNNLSNTITVGVEYLLRSTKTGEVLFERKGTLKVDCSLTSSGGLLGMAANMLNTATTDKVVGARKCNWYVLSDIPAGRYSSLFDKDQQVKAGSATLSGTVKR